MVTFIKMIEINFLMFSPWVERKQHRGLLCDEKRKCCIRKVGFLFTLIICEVHTKRRLHKIEYLYSIFINVTKQTISPSSNMFVKASSRPLIWMHWTLFTQSLLCAYVSYLSWYLYDHLLRLPWLPSHYNINIIKVGRVGKDTLNNTAERSVKKEYAQIRLEQFPTFLLFSFIQDNTSIGSIQDIISSVLSVGSICWIILWTKKLKRTRKHWLPKTLEKGALSPHRAWWLLENRLDCFWFCIAYLLLHRLAMLNSSTIIILKWQKFCNKSTTGRNALLCLISFMGYCIGFQNIFLRNLFHFQSKDIR